MRLKKVKLAGFKSFVDPTTITFPGKLVGIVGPNGCGKSNVIDAVRWVMGESSAKHLRGDSMADVIFNGSAGRKPVGHASIELVFDNSDGSLGGQYAAFAEISIKRQVSRDGQSTYTLNGTRCRRRDITDIFLGTGLGPRSYAIIEQGTISRLIEAKPDDLRIFLEEAAGISKYKERRRETENRMRATRENLDRISDLCNELEKRLQTLQRQAKTAERYKELKQQERLLRAQLQALRWNGLDSETSQQEKQINAMETALEAQVAALRNVEAGIERQRERHIEESEAFNNVQGRVYAVGADIARLEQAIQHARDTRNQQRLDLEQANKAWEEVQTHLVSDQALIENLTGNLAENEKSLHQAAELEKRSALALEEAELAMHGWQQAWDEFNSRAAAQLQAAEVERARIDHLEQHLGQLKDRGKRLDTDLAGLTAATLEDELSALNEQRAELDAIVARLQQQLEDDMARIVDQRQQHQALTAELNGMRTQIQNAKGRQSSLHALQEEALGKGKKSVASWVQDQGLTGAQRLAQALSVEPGWERAVETVLGYSLESLCVDRFASVAQALSALEQGELSLFDTATTVPEYARGDLSALLLDKVRAPWRLDALLAGVYIADDLNEAMSLRPRLGARESVVTRDGVWLGSDWLRLVRGGDAQSSVLVREQTLKALTQEIETLTSQISDLEGKVAESEQGLRELELTREAAQSSLRDVTHRRAGFLADYSGKQERVNQINLRRERMQTELRDLRVDIERDEQELGTARARLQTALEATEGHATQREELLLQRDSCRADLDRIRAQSRADREAMHNVALRVESLRTQLNTTRESLERMQGQLVHLSRRRDDLQHALANGDAPIEAMGVELENLLSRRLEVESQLSEARARVEEVDHLLRELAEQRNAVEQKVQSGREELDRTRLHCQEIRVRRQTLLEQIVESGFELEKLLQEMPPEANEAQWHETVEQVSQQIQRLGAINLAAIDEFAEQSERKLYLDAQHADLTEALQTLENAIRKIDRETRERFQETFDKVNAGFRSMFPRLFGGGQAYLELTGEDLLETGVAVMARPPGKRNSTIHLLSGGEKALTAVALVFSIFELNPAPFCMLDEVDAPLDDANVGRFCNMLKEMSQRVQFIYITHNKGTMEMAEQLIGVTMHEPGVSRLVAVDVDEAVQLAAVS